MARPTTTAELLAGGEPTILADLHGLGHVESLCLGVEADPDVGEGLS